MSTANTQATQSFTFNFQDKIEYPQVGIFGLGKGERRSPLQFPHR